MGVEIWDGGKMGEEKKRCVPSFYGGRAKDLQRSTPANDETEENI